MRAKRKAEREDKREEPSGDLTAVLKGGKSDPQDMWQHLEILLMATTAGVLLAISSGQRSGTLPNVPQGIRQSLMTKNYPPWVGKIPWRRTGQLTPVFLPGESHEQRSLGGYGPLGCKESDTT